MYFMSHSLEFLWEGRIPLKQIKWVYDASKVFQFSEEFERDCTAFWNEMKINHPSIYDGNLLILDRIENIETIPTFYMRSLRFSKLMYHIKKGISLPESLGSLGFQAIILDPFRNYFLLGNRRFDSEYRPSFHAIPGGMFEVEDAKLSIVKACLREIKEEISLKSNLDSFNLLSIIKEEDNSVALIIEVELESSSNFENLADKSIPANDEWLKNILFWRHRSYLFQLDESKMMNGVIYLKHFYRFDK